MDFVGVLRGLQLVLRAASRSQEEYVRHIWANSSIRDILNTNLSEIKKCSEKENFDSMQKNLKEVLERSGVVIEGVRQLASSGIQRDANSSPSGGKNDVGELDISSLTLKELEHFLSQRNNTRIQLSTGNSFTEAVQESIETEKVINNPERFQNDERNVKEWMNFITKQESSKKIETPNLIPPIPEIPVSQKPELASVAKQRKVPSSRIGRMASFGTLFAGVGVSTIGELAKGALGLGGTTNVKEAVFNPNNTERIVDTLCKVRGAALKIGQILSIQDTNMVTPQLAKAFERVRQSADYMPDWQVERMLVSELGSDWEKKLKEFEKKPFAAASIGQVHHGVLHDGTVVAIKIQYPGVAKSIESDIDNLVGMLKVWDVFPPGMFIDNIVRVAKRELAWEVDYIREAEYTDKFGQMVSNYPEYRVPKVIWDLTTKSILTTEFVPGQPLDQCFDLSEDHRTRIGKGVLTLCMRELFTMRCMQTDPNWSNFLYDPQSKQLMLIDFGSTRFYTKEFIDNYIKVMIASANRDRQTVLEVSKTMGFLTGYETKAMNDAHTDAVMILGEVFSTTGDFDFGAQDNTKRIVDLVPTMVAHRLCPPPDEIYSIHRKLSGVFLLCSRLKVKFNCREIFDEIVNDYKKSS